MRWKTIGGVALLALLLVTAGCAGAGEGDPAESVERYLEAKVSGDDATVAALLCSEMEADLERETRTFASVSDVHLEGMACEASGEGATVQCSGRIVALYGAEETEFPLVSYRVVQEDGEWKWCGEAP
jgi:hypothetical protein